MAPSYRATDNRTPQVFNFGQTMSRHSKICHPCPLQLLTNAIRRHGTSRLDTNTDALRAAERSIILAPQKSITLCGSGTLYLTAFRVCSSSRMEVTSLFRPHFDKRVKGFFMATWMGSQPGHGTQRFTSRVNYNAEGVASNSRSHFSALARFARNRKCSKLFQLFLLLHCF